MAVSGDTLVVTPGGKAATAPGGQRLGMLPTSIPQGKREFAPSRGVNCGPSSKGVKAPGLDPIGNRLHIICP